MAANILTAERLRELMNYDPATGEFVRHLSVQANARRGSVAGWVAANGYRYIGIDGRQYLAHRLAYLYELGEFPSDPVDHIDGDRTNNSFANLREASRCLNSQNRRAASPKNKSCGLLGVSRSCLARKPWKAEITANGKRMHIGVYASAEEAHAAYLDVKRALHAGCTI